MICSYDMFLKHTHACMHTHRIWLFHALANTPKYSRHNIETPTNSRCCNYNCVRCVGVWCSALQCVTNMLQCAAVCCSVHSSIWCHTCWNCGWVGAPVCTVKTKMTCTKYSKIFAHWEVQWVGLPQVETESTDSAWRERRQGAQKRCIYTYTYTYI